ncbi:MAG: hypothetical protein J6Q67_03250, partial [Clostridia bacterium]|nr:hypothetical protein [Clostridia bacterium]
EQDAYEYLNRITPKVGSYVDTPEGKGTVSDISLLTGKIKVSLDGSEGLPITVARDDITVLQTCKGCKKNGNAPHHEK